MTAVEQSAMRPEPVEGRVSTSSARMTGRVRRLGGALALVVAPWGFVITNASYAWMIRNGGSDSTGAEALALAATGPDVLRLTMVAGMIGCLLDHPGRAHGHESRPAVSVGIRRRVDDDRRLRLLLRCPAQQHDRSSLWRSVAARWLTTRL